MINQVVLISLSISLSILILLVIAINIAITVNFIKNGSWIVDIIFGEMNKIGKIVCIILNIIVFPIPYLIYGIYELFYFVFYL